MTRVAGDHRFGVRTRVAEIDVRGERARHAFGDVLAREPREIDRCRRRVVVDVRLRARECEQLARRAAGAGGQTFDVDQCFAHAVGTRIGERAFGLQAQAGERRAQLVRGVGDETILQFEQAAQAREQEIDRARQRPDLDRHDALIERRKIARAPAGEMRRQRIEQVQAAADAEPDQHEHEHDEAEHDRQHADRGSRARARGVRAASARPRSR